MSQKYSTVLITGAASGIGAELARLFAGDGYTLILVDRNAEGMESMKAELASKASAIHCLVQDLSPQDAVDQLLAQLEPLNLTVDVLVNNAGFGTFGPFWEIETARDKNLVNVNILVPVLLTKALLPGMVERKRGKILNVGSVSGFGASPYATCYYASKSFLLAFSTGVQCSLEGTGVTSTVVCPGPTRTAFDWTKAEAGGTPPKAKPFQMEAGEVARQAYVGMQGGKSIVIPGWSNKALALTAKFFPRKFSLWLVKRGQGAVN